MAGGDNPFKKDIIDIKISEIKRIFIGNEKYLREMLQDNKKSINELNKFYKKYNIKGKYGIGTRFASSYSIVFVILTNDENISAISTKPFSKRALKNYWGNLENIT